MNKNLAGVLLVGIVLVGTGCIECAPQAPKQWWQSLNVVENQAKIKAFQMAQPQPQPRIQPETEEEANVEIHEVKFSAENHVPEAEPKYQQIHMPQIQQIQPQQSFQPIIPSPAIHMPIQYQHPVAAIDPVVVESYAHVHSLEPFQILKPVLSHTGELIIENTLGGVDFDCRFLPTGHWRDGNFCDVYHACVHGYHRKTYTCPIVGERTFFDERTQRCEFVRHNPVGCSLDRFVR